MTGDSPTSGGPQARTGPAADDNVLPSLASREEVSNRASADIKAGDPQRVCASIRSVATLTVDLPQLADVDPDGLPPATEDLIANTPTRQQEAPETVRADGHLLLFHAGVVNRLTDAQVRALVEGLGEAAVAAVKECESR